MKDDKYQIKTIKGLTMTIYEVILSQVSVFTITKIVNILEDILVNSPFIISEENLFLRVLDCIDELKRRNYVAASYENTYVVISSLNALEVLEDDYEEKSNRE